MESRRQLAIQRKAEEERAKVLEEERKMKEEADRRKKEREPIKYTVKRKVENYYFTAPFRLMPKHVVGG
jgi:hypothetical protein